ncbi:response regulator [Duganella aceris]|uniref:Response regulator n=1 Tax=Duganella aceris TaxID=2703883 RepID=A0ABX0FNX4_9BURK|nr:response regulator [Duganella aceris]
MNVQRGATPGAILIASDNHADAALIQQMLGAEFVSVHISTDPDKVQQDFAGCAPQVLVLAFHRIEQASAYRLALFPLPGQAAAQPHRAILLCRREDVKQAYQLCQRGQFDDYNLFWPMTNDVARLPMSIHLALRELTASVAAPAAAPVELPVVLVVDDDEMVLKLVGTILKDEPYRLVCVGSALEAMAALRLVRPDVILMDIEMPGMDGMQATRHIKADARFADVPVIMITGHSGAATVRDSFRSGAADFIVKPFDREKMIAKVAAAAGREVAPCL